MTAADLVERDDRVAVILGEISLGYFRDVIEAHPRRVLNIGIMEQTMIGVAAGFALEGFHPFVHTIAPFLVDRPFEQLKLDFAYQGLGGTFVSVGASYDYASEGPTHHAAGDISSLLTLPRFELFVPGTSDETDALIRATYSNGNPSYIRTSTSTNEGSFDVAPARIHVVRRGQRATILVVGPMLSAALEATELMDVTVLYTASVRPFDRQTLRNETGDLIIVVAPFLAGALTSIITECLSDPVRIRSIGVPLRHVVSYGTAPQVDEELGLDAGGLRRSIDSLLSEAL